MEALEKVAVARAEEEEVIARAETPHLRRPSGRRRCGNLPGWEHVRSGQTSADRGAWFRGKEKPFAALDRAIAEAEDLKTFAVLQEFRYRLRVE